MADSKVYHRVQNNIINKPCCKEVYDEVNAHNISSSQQTLDGFKKMDDKISKIDKEVTKHGVNIEYIKAQVDKFIDSADKKYAPMWYAEAMKYVMGAVATAIIGAIMLLILK